MLKWYRRLRSPTFHLKLTCRIERGGNHITGRAKSSSQRSREREVSLSHQQYPVRAAVVLYALVSLGFFVVLGHIYCRFSHCSSNQSHMEVALSISYHDCFDVFFKENRKCWETNRLLNKGRKHSHWLLVLLLIGWYRWRILFWRLPSSYYFNFNKTLILLISLLNKHALVYPN